MRAIGPAKAACVGLAMAWCLFGAVSPLPAASIEQCGSEGAPVQVAAVLDDLELALDDGRVLRLAGIDPVRATPSRPNFGEDARRALAGWLAGRTILVKPLAAVPDRWDRCPARVFAESDLAVPAGSGLSINEALLDAGWARAKPEAAIRDDFVTFLAHETKARTSGLGLWSDPYYAIVEADDRKSLAERTGAMVLVEGRLRLHEGRARIFVALGAVSSGVVATLTRHTMASLAKAGLDLRKLVGAKVRLRGFLDDRFGFRIDLVDSGQIEVLTADGPRAPGPSAGLHPAAIAQPGRND